MYSLPHYLNYPVDGERTYYKVGCTSRDVRRRVASQRTTALPEDPVLLRIYTGGNPDARAVERSFHKVLAAAGHTTPKTTQGGTEWFLTSLELLDAVAQAMGLSTHAVEPVV